MPRAKMATALEAERASQGELLGHRLPQPAAAGQVPEPSAVVRYFSRTATTYARRYRRRADFRERWQVWTDLLDRYAEGKKTALDLGCGPGFYSFYLAEKGLEVCGLDPSARMLALCEAQRRRVRGSHPRFRPGALPDVPADLEPADLVLCASVLEYVPALTASVRALGRLVRPGGILIVSLPNRESLHRRWERWSYRHLRFPRYYRFVHHLARPDELASALQPRGFSLLEVRYYAHRSVLSRLGRAAGFSDPRTANLFAAVFEKAR